MLRGIIDLKNRCIIAEVVWFDGERAWLLLDFNNKVAPVPTRRTEYLPIDGVSVIDGENDTSPNGHVQKVLLLLIMTTRELEDISKLVGSKNVTGFVAIDECLQFRWAANMDGILASRVLS